MFAPNSLSRQYYKLKECSRGWPNSGNKVAISSSNTMYAKWVFKWVFWHNDPKRAAPERAFAWPMIFPADSTVRTYLGFWNLQICLQAYSLHRVSSWLSLWLFEQEGFFEALLLAKLHLGPVSPFGQYKVRQDIYQLDPGQSWNQYETSGHVTSQFSLLGDAELRRWELYEANYSHDADRTIRSWNRRWGWWWALAQRIPLTSWLQDF